MTAEHRIAVATVGVIPERWQLARVEVTGHERRLAGSWGTADPYGTLFQAFVQKQEEAFARMNACQPRAAELRRTW